MNSNKVLRYLPALIAALSLALLPFSFELGASVIAVGGLLAIAAHDYSSAERRVALVPAAARASASRQRLPLAA